MKKLNFRGDTIVEALIATVIIGLTVGLAYGIASRSLRSAQQSQERLEALKLAEGQVEAMKGLVAQDSKEADDKVFAGSSLFCLDNNEHVSFTVAPPLPALDQDNLSVGAYPQDCIKDPDGRYHLAVERTRLTGPDIPANRYQFTVTVRWFGLGGLEKEEVRIEYRLHP